MLSQVREQSELSLPSSEGGRRNCKRNRRGEGLLSATFVPLPQHWRGNPGRGRICCAYMRLTTNENALALPRHFHRISGRPCVARTRDQRIKSPLLYQLS